MTRFDTFLQLAYIRNRREMSTDLNFTCGKHYLLVKRNYIFFNLFFGGFYENQIKTIYKSIFFHFYFFIYPRASSHMNEEKINFHEVNVIFLLQCLLVYYDYTRLSLYLAPAQWPNSQDRKFVLLCVHRLNFSFVTF